MDDYWIIEHATDSRYVWGQWGWTDDLAAAMRFTKDAAANTPARQCPVARYHRAQTTHVTFGGNHASMY